MSASAEAEKAWQESFGSPFDWDQERCRWWAYGYMAAQQNVAAQS